MEEIGKVISRFNRFLVCRTKKKAKLLLGQTVYSEKKKPVGIVVDVFGPVERPYLKVLKRDGDQASTLYRKQ
ncbi:MAG: H/ACA RNA-protein complex protein Gar1 [Theionarchaea archaeon]|nr:H/ACA RNA-protein complex protein Gar1 [Theionarchaea archaeon]